MRNFIFFSFPKKRSKAACEITRQTFGSSVEGAQIEKMENVFPSPSQYVWAFVRQIEKSSKWSKAAWECKRDHIDHRSLGERAQIEKKIRNVLPLPSQYAGIFVRQVQNAGKFWIGETLRSIMVALRARKWMIFGSFRSVSALGSCLIFVLEEISILRRVYHEIIVNVPQKFSAIIIHRIPAKVFMRNFNN